LHSLICGDIEIYVVIIGGAGFIGSHLVERFLKKGNHVLCFDNFDDYYDPSIKRNNVAPFIDRDNFTLLEGDIRDRNVVDVALEGADLVYHLAAQGGIRASVENPLEVHEINTTGTLNILKSALDRGVTKVIYASSSSVYGKVEYLPFDERHPCAPLSPYGVSKLIAEEYCRVFSEIYGLKTVALRYFTVYGPRMRPDLAINIFTRRAFQNLPLKIFGSGEKTRDFTYIDDVVEASVKAIQAESRVFNIGNGHRITIKGLADLIIAHTGSTSKIVHMKEAKGDAQHTWAAIDRAKRELSWTPNVSIEDGVKRYIDWFRSKNACKYWINSS
jgi:UDP-glucose 4-epimerase